MRGWLLFCLPLLPTAGTAADAFVVGVCPHFGQGKGLLKANLSKEDESQVLEIRRHEKRQVQRAPVQSLQKHGRISGFHQHLDARIRAPEFLQDRGKKVGAHTVAVSPNVNDA